MTPNRERAPYAAGRRAVLALRSEIEKMRDEGTPLSQIYEQHRSQLRIGYRQFLRHVAQYIDEQPSSPKPKKTKFDEHQENKKTDESLPLRVVKRPRGFDPMNAPKAPQEPKTFKITTIPDRQALIGNPPAQSHVAPKQED